MVTQPRKATKGLVVPFDRLQEALDDAVRRGRMQRKDAEELAARLLTTVGARTEEALGGMQDLVGTATARMVRGLGGQADGALAIADYEDLTAAQVTQNLDGLSDAQLRAIREHEVHHANRVSVLRAIDRQLG